MSWCEACNPLHPIIQGILKSKFKIPWINRIDRTYYLDETIDEFNVHQVCCFLGPRQCGKTTLALEYKKRYLGSSFLFDLENPEDLEALQNPLKALEDLEGLVIIDEILFRKLIEFNIKHLCKEKV